MNNQFNILNSLIDSIAVINKFGEIIFTNLAWRKFSDINKGNVNCTGCGINYLELCRNVTGAELKNATEAKLGIEKIINREIEIFELEYPCHSDIEKRWFIMRVRPHITNKELTIISHINITNRKLSEEKIDIINNQLHLVNDRLKTTIYNVSHDIQSPLNSIEGLINLSKLAVSDDKITSYFELIEKSVKNLKNYIQETIEISSSSSNSVAIKFDSLLNTIFESIKFNPIFKLLEIKVNIKQDVDFNTIKDELITVFLNLLSNCLKYYDKNKKVPYIYININVNDNEAIISIKDNGIGIDKNVIPNIFNINYQVKENSKLGAGIGLYLVQKSLHILKGQITVNSTLGFGTEFIVTIPNLDGIKIYNTPSR